MAGAEDTTGGQNRLMLYDVSDELAKRNVCIDQLKFALFDFILNKEYLRKAKKPFDIFSELGKTRKLPEVINILIALFKLLWLDALNDIFFKSGFPTADIQPTNVFSSFRISIVNMSNHLQNSKISRISGVFAVPKEKCVNQWKLLQYLQDEGELNKGNLIQFVEKFGINKDTLEWHPSEASLALQPALQPTASDHTAQAASSSVYLASGSKPHFRSSHASQLSSFSGYTASANQFVSEGALQIPAHTAGAVNAPDNQPASLGVPQIPANTAEEPGQKYARLGDKASSSTRDLRARPASTSSQATDRSGNGKRKFRKFLSNISKQYPGNHYRWLRFLLFDIIPISVLSKNNNGMFLFNELASRGLISFTNVTILSDIADVTGLVAAQEYVKDYKQETSCKEGNGVTPCRKNLFKGLLDVTNSELDRLVAYYNLSHIHFDNVWDLVFELESQKELDNKEKWIGFADCLNKQAKCKIRDALEIMKQPVTDTELRINDAIATSKETDDNAAEAKTRVKEARKAVKKADKKAMKDEEDAMKAKEEEREAKAAETEAKAAEREAEAAEIEAKARSVEAEKEAEELKEKARAAKLAAKEAETKAREAETKAKKAKEKLFTAETVAGEAKSISKEKAKLARKSKRAAEKAKADLTEAEKLEEASVKAAKEAAATLNSLLQNT